MIRPEYIPIILYQLEGLQALLDSKNISLNILISPTSFIITSPDLSNFNYTWDNNRLLNKVNDLDSIRDSLIHALVIKDIK